MIDSPCGWPDAAGYEALRPDRPDRPALRTHSVRRQKGGYPRALSYAHRRCQATITGAREPGKYWSLMLSVRVTGAACRCARQDSSHEF
jgi:hypothetical protein